jgi:DNA-binding MarR family transcriptional regulator
MTERAPLDRDQLAVYFALMEVGSLLQYAVEKQLQDDGGISWVQFQILAGLTFHPDGRQRMTDIADRIVYSRSGLTYQARELEKNGYITRNPDPADQRSTIISITDQGRSLVRAILPAHEQVVRRKLLDGLTPADAATLTRILAGVLDTMRSHPPRSARPRGARPTD